MTDIIPAALRHWIYQHRNEDPASLALHFSNKSDLDYRKGIAQIRAYRKARAKIPHWARNSEIVWPPAMSIEQCSSEATARFKSSEVHGRLAVDLTGGVGIDCYYLSKSFRHVIYVENDPQLCALAEHNFRSLGAHNIEVVHSRAEDFIASFDQTADLMYLDPSRRPEAVAAPTGSREVKPWKKVFRIEDAIPNVFQLLPAMKGQASKILIKLSPLLDLSHAASTIAGLSKLYVVAVDRECKEVLALVGAGDVPLHIEAVHIESGEVKRVRFYPEDERSSRVSYSLPLRYLYEPNPALLKAGAFRYLAQKYGVKKLHSNTHLYTSNDRVPFPGKAYRIDAVSPYNQKSFKKASTADTYTIKTRNFPDAPERIRRKLKISEGQDGFLFAVTLADNRPAVVLCSRESSQTAQNHKNSCQQE